MTEDSRRTWLAPGELIRTLKSNATLSRKRRIPRGRDLYRQDETSPHFYLILSGLLKISTLRADGTEVILEFMGADTICGEGPAIDGLPRFSTATAIEDTEVLEFNVADWDVMEGISPGFLMAILQITALKQRVLAVRLEQLFSREPEGRILELFERLATVSSKPSGDAGFIVPQLTHENIAAMTGMTRVTVTRALNRLKQQGDIYFENGRFHLSANNQ